MVRAASAGTVQRVGQIAVVLDQGNLALPRNAVGKIVRRRLG